MCVRADIHVVWSKEQATARCYLLFSFLLLSHPAGTSVKNIYTAYNTREINNRFTECDTVAEAATSEDEHKLTNSNREDAIKIMRNK